MDASRDAEAERHLRAWRRLAPAGLALVGFGASLLGYAVEVRIGGAGPLRWIAWGTVALVVLNGGLAVFGEAVKRRALHEWTRRSPR